MSLKMMKCWLLLISAYIQEAMCDEKNDKRIEGIVALRRSDTTLFGEGHFCAGVILTENVVLTAGTCVGKVADILNEYTAVAGGPELKVPRKNTQIRQWVDYVGHNEDHDPGILIDLALIEVNEPFKLISGSVGIMPITKKSYEDGDACKVYGWGNSQVTLKDNITSTAVKLISGDKCVEKHPELLINTICASNTNNEPCELDGGGPLICNGELYGILSAPHFCGDKKTCYYTDIFKSSRFIFYALDQIISGHMSKTITIAKPSLALLLLLLIIYYVLVK